VEIFPYPRGNISMHQKTPPREGWKIGLSLLLALWTFLVLVLSSNAMASPPSRTHEILPLEATAPPAEAEQLTQSLVALSARYQRAAAPEQAQLRQEMVELAEARQQQLAALMKEYPGEVLRLALPSHVQARMPAAVRAYLEEEVELEGEVEVFIEDYDRTSRTRYFLKTAAERVSLHFAARPPQLQSGTRLRLKGVRVDSALALESGDSSVSVLEAALKVGFSYSHLDWPVASWGARPRHAMNTSRYAQRRFLPPVALAVPPDPMASR
jgi:hypothetical protein